MTTPDLDAIRRRLESTASATPWINDGDHIRGPEGDIVAMEVWEDGDRDFIAHAPEDIRTLLAEVERLQRAHNQAVYEGDKARRERDKAEAEVERLRAELGRLSSSTLRISAADAERFLEIIDNGTEPTDALIECMRLEVIDD